VTDAIASVSSAPSAPLPSSPRRARTRSLSSAPPRDSIRAAINGRLRPMPPSEPLPIRASSAAARSSSRESSPPRILLHLARRGRFPPPPRHARPRPPIPCSSLLRPHPPRLSRSSPLLTSSFPSSATTDARLRAQATPHPRPCCEGSMEGRPRDLLSMESTAPAFRNLRPHPRDRAIHSPTPDLLSNIRHPRGRGTNPQPSR
jgi:hypothetical protein